MDLYCLKECVGVPQVSPGCPMIGDKHPESRRETPPPRVWEAVAVVGVVRQGAVLDHQAGKTPAQQVEFDKQTLPQPADSGDI